MSCLRPVLPGRWGALRIRFGARDEVGQKVRVKVTITTGKIFERELSVVTDVPAKFNSYSLNKSLTELYMYIEKDNGVQFKRLLMDARR